MFTPNMGIFNLYFLMNWVEWSLGMRVDKTSPLIAGKGKLLAGEKFAYRVHMDRDPEMFGQLYALYTSDRQATVPNQAPLWKCSKLVGDSPYEFVQSQDDGSEKVELPNWTGYWKIKFELRHLFAGLVSQYMEEIHKGKYSYRFESSKLTLYFANSIGASLGLPPAASHLDCVSFLGMGDGNRRDFLSTLVASVPNWDDQRFDDNIEEGEEWDIHSDYDYESADEDNTSVLTEFSIGQNGEKIESTCDNC